MQFQNYYEILGLTRDCNDLEIKRAYHKAALQKHPDKNHDNPNANEEFKLVNKAYETLHDAAQRYEYNIVYEKNFSAKKEREKAHTSQEPPVKEDKYAAAFFRDVKRKVERDARRKREKQRDYEMRRARFEQNRAKQREERRRKEEEERLFHNIGRDRRRGNAYGAYVSRPKPGSGLWPRDDALRTFGQERSKPR